MRLAPLFLVLSSCVLHAQEKPACDTTGTAARLQWFKDAKLGIFIHWGIYSVGGVGESWSFHNGAIPHADYMKQIKGFTAKHYDPAAWADLVAKSGAKYAVITTKHHDGVALYDTKLAPGGRKKPLSVVAASPCGRDVIAPFFTELRKRDIKCGAYFSLIDWSDPDYPGFLRDSSRYAIKDDPARWQRFCAYNQGQIGELCKLFHPDLFWFDGDWEHSAEEWQAA
ncbi:MAG: alpha-L-fucosidase, partial [Acidobacteria bacterium]|nr:alpha-L-fucosidase [Acidobacteriota bacterium]